MIGFQDHVDLLLTDGAVTEPKPALQATHDMAARDKCCIDLTVEPDPAFVGFLLFMGRLILLIVHQISDEALEVFTRVFERHHPFGVIWMVL